MLEQLFGSRTRFKLLKLFFTHPEESLFVREISRKTGERINSVRRELDNLVHLGIIEPRDQEVKPVRSTKKKASKKSKAAKKRFYQISYSFPLYQELKELILKSHLLLEKSLSAGMKKMGSVGLLALTGMFVGEDDFPVDVLIVGSVNKTRLKNFISRLEKSFGQEINYACLSRKEYDYRHEITDKFLFKVLDHKKIVLIDKMAK